MKYNTINNNKVNCAQHQFYLYFTYLCGDNICATYTLAGFRYARPRATYTNITRSSLFLLCSNEKVKVPSRPIRLYPYAVVRVYCISFSLMLYIYILCIRREGNYRVVYGKRGCLHGRYIIILCAHLLRVRRQRSPTTIPYQMNSR